MFYLHVITSSQKEQNVEEETETVKKNNLYVSSVQHGPVPAVSSGGTQGPNGPEPQNFIAPVVSIKTKYVC